MAADNKVVHFLIAEDDVAQRELIRLALDQNHVKLTLDCVGDGEEAIDYLRQNGRFKDAKRPDVVLLDLKMPKLNGHEVLDQIKTDPSLRSIPVIILTTSSNEEDRSKAYERYANSYLVKPLDFQTFQELMNDLKHYWGQWNQTAFRH